MSASYPPHTPPQRSGQSDVFIRPVNAELIGYTAPQGFGSVREEQRYHDIINDNAETAPDFNDRPSGVGGHYYPPCPPRVANYSDPFADKPYEDTILYFHHGKRGVQFIVQANRKMFVMLVVLLLIVVNSPGITDMIGKLVRSVMGAN